MRYDPESERTRLDPYPAADPGRPPPAVGPQGPPDESYPAGGRRWRRRPAVESYADVGEDSAEGDRYRRARVVSLVCTVISVVTAIFAVVLGVHIVLVLGNANITNGFASFVDGWASGIRLGLTGLFTPGDPKLGTLLNEGIAAILWLVIGGLLTYLIRRFAMPGPRYRR